MGCDYYIIKQLEIKSINNNYEEEVYYIELNRKRCYFEYEDTDSKDSDDTTEDYENYYVRFNRKYGKYLESNYVPRLLFNQGKWKNDKIRDKYEDIVRQKIGNNSIANIIKQEVRYFR